MAEPSSSVATPVVRETANDRFKRRFGTTFWSSLIAAVSLHFLLFAFFPTLSVADMADTDTPTVVVPIIPEVVLPPMPEAIQRPAVPVASDVPPPEFTLPRNVMVPGAAGPLAEPPVSRESEARARRFTPFTVAPQLRNGEEIERLLQRRYPPLLRDAGIRGVVRVLVHIDENGQVLDAKVEDPSEHSMFNDLALDVVRSMKFSPALNRDRRVPVWVSIPIRFEIR